jgi:hypothetical protein
MNGLKIILATLLFLCLLKMPYGYYQLVRFISFVGFLVLSYDANERKNNFLKIIYLSLAILFQPLIKIPLGRELWNIVDVIVGVFLLGSLFRKSLRS